MDRVRRFPIKSDGLTNPYNGSPPHPNFTQKVYRYQTGPDPASYSKMLLQVYC